MTARQPASVDVLIGGAGRSGIGTAYYLQRDLAAEHGIGQETRLRWKVLSASDLHAGRSSAHTISSPAEANA